MENLHFNTGPAVPKPFPFQKMLEAGAEQYDAEELLEEMLQKGERPIVTFPRDLLSKVQTHGLQPRKSWIPGFEKVVGTLGIPPYRDNPDRVTVRILIDDPKTLQPRMTGTDMKFHGVVVFNTPVSPSQIELFESNTQPEAETKQASIH